MLRGARRTGVISGAVGLCLAFAACSSNSNGVTLQTPPAAPSTASPATPPSTSPASPTGPGADAAAVYRAFWDAAFAAQRDPARFVRTSKAAEPVSRRSFDPFRAQVLAYVYGLSQDRQAFRGDPPQARVSVQSVDMDAKPYPLVVLRNCPTVSTTWRQVDLRTGKVVPGPKDDVPPPWGITVQMIYVSGHWGASSVSVEMTRTCTVE